MIIVITNRKLPAIPQDNTNTIKVTDMGVVLGDRQGDEDIIHTGLLSDDDAQITFYPKGKESELFSSISTAELNKPWVFFMHGFHQDPEENIMKARQLHDHHKVNVVAFAWPSKPLDKSYTVEDATKNVVSGLFMSVPIAGILVNIFKNYVIDELKDTAANYIPAQENAEASHVDLVAAMKLLKEQLKTSQPPVFVVHSMGNYLLENTVKRHESLPMQFSNIVLHQADVNAKGHEWVEGLTVNLDVVNHPLAKLYVTTSCLDRVLGASCVRRLARREQGAERLGQTRLQYIPGDIHYLDFSDGPKIETDHEMFRRSKDETNPYVFDCLGRIFRGEEDGLPLEQGKSSAGFSKMPTAASLYQLEIVLDPVDSEWEGEGEPTTTSLSIFKDPLAPEEVEADIYGWED